jgi:hypothetical protein
MIRTIVMHTDPGHGWAEVPRQELFDLGIADKITQFSYQKGDKVFLEEDCDLTTFCEKLRARNVQYVFDEQYKNYTPIRNYQRFAI